jgi:hypothetical protein
MWGFEYGQTRGYHFHMLFFFDGAGLSKISLWVTQSAITGQQHHARGRGVFTAPIEQKKLQERGYPLGSG